MLQIKRGLTAIIGGGGKTTLLHALAQECAAKGTVVIATSTKMRVPDWCPVLLDSSVGTIREVLEETSVICAGTIHEPAGKLDAPNIPFEDLAEIADYVLIEADGAKMLPCKAHASYEPVIPACTSQSIYVLGIDCIGKPIADTCHRADLFAQIANANVHDMVTPDMVAQVLKAENLGDQLLINKVESSESWIAAKAIATQLSCPVVAGSLWEGMFQCLS